MSKLKDISVAPPGRQQDGFIVVVVAVFLLILMAGSAQLFGRIADDTRTSGVLRDSSASLMLAETAMEYLRGQYINTLDTVAETPTNGLDQVIAGQLTGNMSDPDDILFPYMFYVTAGAGLDQTLPSLLQKVANGEAAAVDSSALTTRGVSADVNQMRVNDLFASPNGTSVAPMLYILDDNTGLLTASNAEDWDSETSPEKAAVWLEVIQNPNNSSSVDLFVQAIAQVGEAKSYVQRYVGTYSSVLGNIAALSEASNIDRSDP